MNRLLAHVWPWSTIADLRRENAGLHREFDNAVDRNAELCYRISNLDAYIQDLANDRDVKAHMPHLFVPCLGGPPQECRICDQLEDALVHNGPVGAT